ncbi:MAG: N-6 DNA methylase [Rhodospirillaceae bacterium]|nr:N-6 DNA methylase [Rhodospirillaceae bacterium]
MAYNGEPGFERSVARIMGAPWPPPDEQVAPLDSGMVADEAMLAALSVALGASTVPRVTAAEAALLDRAPDVPGELITATLDRIEEGGDPLGDAFCTLRPAARRREDGADYTPPAIVRAMLSWAEGVGDPDRVIDPGAGSGRFLLEAGRRFPAAALVAVERDPLAALTVRANLAVAGMAGRAEVRVEDFLTSNLRGADGHTLFVGNPPYVRHHLIPPEWKEWLKREAAAMELQASALAGLHVYFFLAIARRAKAGDYGALITASEWLDVNYGGLVRDLFLHRLGGQSIHVIEPKAEPFPGTAATGAVTSFTVNGKPKSARFARVTRLSALGDLSGGRRVSRERLTAEKRWSHFTRTPTAAPEGYVELGDLCRVHRGQVTGANHVWIAGAHSADLPDDVLFPTVTRAKELIQSGPVLSDPDKLKRVIDLPSDLSAFRGAEYRAVKRFLERAEKMGAKESYTAKHRRFWWSLSLRAPAPILATYMARREPAFVLNGADARHLNIAHGIYPREPMEQPILTALAAHLRNTSSVQGGRVYAGGLTKFEPREMERIPVPAPETLVEMAA